MRTWRRSMVVGVVGVAATTLVAPPASAMAPAQPARCSFSFGALHTEISSGTEILSAVMDPAVAYQECGVEQPFTATITTTGGAVPAGVADDPLTYPTFEYFSADRLRPEVQFEWIGACTTTPQALNLEVSTAGARRTYPLGTSETCASRNVPGSSLQAGAQQGPQGPPVSVTGLAPDGSGGGYRLVDEQGRVSDEGDAPALGAQPSTQAPVVAIVAAPTGDGYWLLDGNGDVFAYGTAADHGSVQGEVHAAMAGLAPDPATGGYWFATEGGGIFTADAPFYGSIPGESIHPAGLIVGIAATPDGRGYWLAGADGGVFSFGDARFFGSAGGVALAAPITGFAATPDGGGYWLVGADGGVLTYGDARYYGSVPGQGIRGLGGPVDGIVPTSDGAGYWLVGADGGVFTYGDARFHGSPSASYAR